MPARRWSITHHVHLALAVFVGAGGLYAAWELVTVAAPLLLLAALFAIVILPAGRVAYLSRKTILLDDDRLEIRAPMWRRQRFERAKVVDISAVRTDSVSVEDGVEHSYVPRPRYLVLATKVMVPLVQFALDRRNQHHVRTPVDLLAIRVELVGGARHEVWVPDRGPATDEIIAAISAWSPRSGTSELAHP